MHQFFREKAYKVPSNDSDGTFQWTFNAKQSYFEYIHSGPEGSSASTRSYSAAAALGVIGPIGLQWSLRSCQVPGVGRMTFYSLMLEEAMDMIRKDS